MPTTTKNLISVINPCTEEKIAEYIPSSEKEIKEKVSAAKDAFIYWSSLEIEKRIQYVRKIYDLIIDRREEIAKAITKNTGKPLAEAYLTEIASTLQVAEYCIKNSTELLSKRNIALGKLYPTKKSFLSYEPYGVIAIIQPWNYPFYLPFSAIIKALVSGNCFVFKPSSTTSFVGELINKILVDAKLPNGVANIIYGDSESAKTLLSCNIDKVVFTGSVNVGKKIAYDSMERLIPLSLELGGKDPAIVLKSCNLDYACGGILWGALSNTGQACASIERVYVESEVFDEFIEKFTFAVKELKVGDGDDDETDIGPLINEEQVKKIEAHINDAVLKGAKIHIGGKRLEKKGFFFEPTVLSNVDHTMEIMNEETFGPVIPIMRFSTLEEAVILANKTKYGLAASIWTGDLEPANNMAKNLNCGTVWVNDSLFLQAHPACPWQGYKESGYGGSSIFDFVRTKHISVDQGYIPFVRPKSYWWFPYKGKARSYFDLVEVLFRSGVKEKAKAVFNTFIDFLK